MRYVSAREMLDFQQAHARARDAVHYPLDSAALARELGGGIVVKSAARDRAEYLRRPDLGRRLSDDSRAVLDTHKGEYQAAFVVAYFGPALGLGIALAYLWRRAEARLDQRRTDQQRSV